MNFKNISIIFAFLSLNIKVLSSPVEDITTIFTSLNNNTEVSSNAVNNSVDEVDVSIEELDMVNDADLSFEVEMDAENVTDSEFETDSEIELDDMDEIDEMESEIINENECLTPECFEISKGILSRMDVSVDPCEDFYQFSCGGWMKENEIPKNEFGISTTNEIDNNNKNIIHNILEGEYPVDLRLSPEDQELDREIFNKIKTIYNSCMDESTINKQGREPIINLLNKFDLYNNKEKYVGVIGITNLIADLHQYGVHFIFSSYVRKDLLSNNNYINIAQPSLLLQNDYYKYGMVIFQCKTMVMETFNRIFGDQNNGRNIEEMAEKIVEFEKKLSKITVITGKNQNNIDFYNPMKIKKLKKNCQNIDWIIYFKKVFQNYGINISVDDNYRLNVAPDYFESLNKLLSETDIDTLIYYAEWNIIINYIQYTSDDISKPFNDFVNYYVYGIEEKKERYKTCIDITEDLMGDALGKYFVAKAFDNRSKEVTKEIIENIKQAMLIRIPKMSWLDLPTANYAIEKVYKLSTENIGYPDYILKPKELLKEYEGFEIDSNVFFNTIVNYAIYLERKNIKKIELPANKNEWLIKPQTVNAYYYPYANSITITAGFLQPPFLNPQQPDYLNYGATGCTIGHELIHAYDTNGSFFDADGVPLNWWTNSTKYDYNVFSMCLVDQYNKYSYKISDDWRINLNGVRTLDENLADNGGLSRAFEAWKLSSKDEEKFKERNKGLPGLSKYTPEQLFFIAFGQSFCEKGTPEIAKKLIDTNEHSLGQYRIIGSVSNSEPFAEAFNCPKRSPMNPDRKCQVW